MGNITQPVANKPQADEVINIRHYFNVINKFKWPVILLAVIVTMLAAVITLNITPVFRATATLLIEAEQAKAISYDEVYGLDSTKKEYYLTQFEILKSRKIAQAVVNKLDLSQHRDFAVTESLFDIIKQYLPFIPPASQPLLSPTERYENRQQQLVKEFAQRMTISPLRKTQLVNISFESTDPALAALVANTVGEVYIEQHLSAKMGITKKAAGWLTTRLSDLRVRLDQSEEKLQQYREQENLIDIEGVLGLLSSELEQTSRQLVVARHDKNKLASIVRVINEYGRDNLEMLESITEITSHKVIENIKQTLVTQELKVSELAEIYGPKHPKMIAADAELNTVKVNLSKQIKRLISGVEKELNTNKRNVQALETELTRIRAQYQVVTRKENNYRQLLREVQTNRQIYNTFFSRAKETEVTSDFNAAVARFTDRAFRPNKAVKPNKPLVILITFILTLVFAVIIAFTVENLNDTFKSATDIENKLSQRMLGMLPLVVLSKGSQMLLHYFFDNEGKKFAEAVRTLRTSFVLTQLNKSSKVIEVTSSVPGEGKTTIATNLAFSLGQMEKTILIDADMRKPSICKRFDIPLYHPALANLIAGTEKFEDCIYHDEASDITVMPCGQLPPNPLELLASERFVKLLEVLKQTYEHYESHSFGSLNFDK